MRIIYFYLNVLVAILFCNIQSIGAPKLKNGGEVEPVVMTGMTMKEFDSDLPKPTLEGQQTQQEGKKAPHVWSMAKHPKHKGFKKPEWHDGKASVETQNDWNALMANSEAAVTGDKVAQNARGTHV